MAMRILIVGAGAVGGYFGGRLAEAGRDVTFLVRPSRAKQLRQDGLRIISPHGDAVLTPKLVSAGEIDAPYDLVFLAVKAYALEAAMNDLGPAVGPETMILPVLNGMRHLDLLMQRFRTDAVIGGVCNVAVAQGPGRMRRRRRRLRPPAVGAVPGTTRRRDDCTGISADILDVSRSAHGRACRGRSYPGRPAGARRRAESRCPIAESRFRPSTGLLGRAVEALRRAAA
jgi:2-dehydropantoate 2-reductase